MYTCILTYIPKYINITCSGCLLPICMLVFRSYHLVLDKQLICPSMGRLLLQPSTFHSCLCVQFRNMSFHPSCKGTLACLLLVVSVQRVIPVRLIGCSFLHYQQTQSHNKFPDPLDFAIFLPLLLQCSLSLSYESCFVDVSVGTRLYNSAV